MTFVGFNANILKSSVLSITSPTRSAVEQDDYDAEDESSDGSGVCH